MNKPSLSTLAAGDAARSRPPTPAALSGAADAAWVRDAVEQFEVPLTQYAARLLSGDIERARDVVQDAFLKLWTADRATVDGHLGQWLYRVCRNRALDVRRKESRMMTALQDGKIEGIEAPRHRGIERASDLMPGCLDASMPSADASMPSVMALLETLNDTQQEALRLKFQGGLSYKEIASVMDITSNHVGVLIHNAIKALRERFVTFTAEAQRRTNEKGFNTTQEGPTLGFSSAPLR